MMNLYILGAQSQAVGEALPAPTLNQDNHTATVDTEASSDQTQPSSSSHNHSQSLPCRRQPQSSSFSHIYSRYSRYTL